MTGDLFTFLYFHLITSKFIYFQHEARCSEYCDVVGIPFLHMISFILFPLVVYLLQPDSFKANAVAFSILSALVLRVGQSCIVACLIVHASVNSLASFHTVRITGCLFTELVQLLCRSGCLQT